MVRVAVVGLGKMGLSHLAMINAHPKASVVAVCDTTGYLLDVLNKYTGLRIFNDFDRMLADVELDAVIIATPSSMHATMVEAALRKELHVFCEKPFCLKPTDGERLTALAAELNLVNQVGYHNRFVGTFQEVKRLIALNVVGEITHVLAEAYGPVVLRPKGSTWRTRREEGGGCLYDYAAHPLNLVNWYLGMPEGVGGAILNKVFSSDTDDEVFGTLYFSGGRTGQISVNWSDESCRKMTTKISVWGTAGRIYADRQECQVFLRDTANVPSGYQTGWNVKYTTDLTEEVWFYIRGEEYSAQLDHFVATIEQGRPEDNVSSFAEALMTDKVMAMLLADAEKGPTTRSGDSASASAPAQKRRGFFSRNR